MQVTYSKGKRGKGKGKRVVKDAMSEADITFQFEDAHACVIFTNRVSAATGLRMPKLYVQVIDAYRYQREWTIEFRHRPGDSGDVYWESHIYRHPGVRCIVELSKERAIRIIRRVLYLAANYRGLLFNEDDSGGRARCEGFVHFADVLHQGATPSVRLLP